MNIIYVLNWNNKTNKNKAKQRSLKNKIKSWTPNAVHASDPDVAITCSHHWLTVARLKWETDAP